MDRPLAGVLWGMRKLTTPAAVAALALTLAACGGSARSSHPSPGGAQRGGASGVLVDGAGMALYTPDGESAANVRCTGPCAAIWKPLRPGAAKLAGSAVITRPDGSKQVAIAGKPLYTFVQDAPGSVTGNGASDMFGARQFTWHVVKAAGRTAATPSSPSPGQSTSPSRGYSNGY